MLKKRKFLRFLLITLGLLPLLILIAFFIPATQKYLVENQLTPWISNVSVDYIHLNPFSIKIDNLKLKYEAIDVHISHLNSEISPFSLLSQRIKINKFILDHIQINDATIATEADNSIPLFYGLFPYFDTGYIYDIGLLDAHAEYNSPATGAVQVSLSGQEINETTDNAIKLNVTAKELWNIPEIKGASLNSSIILRQHTDIPVHAQQSHFNLILTTTDGNKQTISAQLSMKQLSKPDKWATFPFDKRQIHYLRERLHPEEIDLQITHTDHNKKVLADINYNGQYDGNEGIISGTIKLLTDKDFTAQLKKLALPKIESQLTATFQYNTRSLEGNINLLDDFSIEDYISGYTDKKESSLPEQLDISNHLIASINDNRLNISSFVLDILSDEQKYVTILTHKPLSINLNDLPEFLEQKNSDLVNISINQLPLNWFNDFVSEYQIENGIIDTDINLALENKTLKLISNRPVSLRDITILEAIKNKKESPPPLVSNQNIEADLTVKINNDNLDTTINQFKLYQKNKNNEVIEQISISGTLNLSDPVAFFEGSKEINQISLAAQTKGRIDLQALTKVPVIARNIAQLTHMSNNTDPDNENQDKNPTLSDSLPKALSLNYELGVEANSSTWNIHNSTIEVTTEKNSEKIFLVKNSQDIQFKQNKEQLSLLTKGQLFSLQMNRFNFNWISPLIKKYAAPYKLAGKLDKLNLTISSADDDTPIEPKTEAMDFLIDLKQLRLSNLQSYENEKLLFEKININTTMRAHYSPEKLTINYPSLAITKGTAQLINNSGKVSLINPGNDNQQLAVTGKLNGFLHNLMDLSITNQFTKNKAKLTQQSLLNAHYSLKILDEKLTINNSEFKILHPENNGQLILKINKPVSLSLQGKQYNFAKNGRLSFKLINFDIKPYEPLLPELPISFDHANGNFDLIQTKKKQKFVTTQAFIIRNIHVKDNKKELLEPFDITLDFSANQYKNITHGKIKKLSLSFINQETNALDLNTRFKLDMNKDIILSELDGSLDLIITQWLKQPAALPDNTLKQGTLNTHFKLDNKNNITHHWLINNLVAQDDTQLVKSITIDGTGKLHNLSSFDLDLPIIMKSISGESNLLVKTQTTLHKENKKIAMSIDGKEIFLNDLLKLLAVINPKSEISQLDSSAEKNKKDSKFKTVESTPASLDKSPALEPFWQSGFDISGQLKINKLYYSDYMSFQEIVGKLDITDKKFHAEELKIKFHESPVLLDALFKFNNNSNKPYDIKVNTSLSQFELGKFLRELDPIHVPRADGIFDMGINIYGDLSNLSQIQNELLFDMLIEGKGGVYHFIPADDIMMRSSGAGMAIVGEIVSVLPTAGFGLGIVNRVIRFAKDIHYDFIKMHLIRKDDLDTKIQAFQILSPEIHLLATGGLSFKENTRLINQPLKMDAQLNLAGEGAAIFYSLGLLNKEQDEYGFWKGPIINISGTLSHQEDNFDEIISKAKSGTVVGGITNPFSGIIGDFKYRWFGDPPDYNELHKKDTGTQQSK